MVVHPAAGNASGTLVNALLYHLEGLSGIGGEKRPGIIHRLDKDTSGLLLVAKTDAAHIHLSRQLAERTMEKHYYAVVAGVMKHKAGIVDANIGRSPRDRKKMAALPTGGRTAQTVWTVKREWTDRSLFDIHLITGRTHQIRVHMASIHHPVLGDTLYGSKQMPFAPRLMLHAWSLTFTHPLSADRITITSLPDAVLACPIEDYGLSLARGLGSVFSRPNSSLTVTISYPCSFSCGKISLRTRRSLRRPCRRMMLPFSTLRMILSESVVSTSHRTTWI
jgi:23S rRNA pseudouridine1911/1915/1917 synthase